jgi:hypothetical protein
MVFRSWFTLQAHLVSKHDLFDIFPIGPALGEALAPRMFCFPRATSN